MADKESPSGQTPAKTTAKATSKADKATAQSEHKLIRRANIGGKWREKGATVSLTTKGRQQFKQEGKIK